MRAIVGAFGLAVALSLIPHRAAANIIIADVVVQVDKTTQRMSVFVDGATQFTWKVSTAAGGYTTPSGIYRPELMARQWYSHKYHMSPMPHSIFFRGGWAIHGSFSTGALGSPASHGCVRLHPTNAATLFALVEKHGPQNTAIVIMASTPSPKAISDHPRRHKRHVTSRPDAKPVRSVSITPVRAPRI